ncbi:hypothetical protein D3C81_764710 [compost metagenome]
MPAGIRGAAHSGYGYEPAPAANDCGTGHKPVRIDESGIPWAPPSKAASGIQTSGLA